MKRQGFLLVLAGFALVAGVFGVQPLDTDEFKVVKGPYQMMGGDYTLGYLKAHEYRHALDCAARAYRLYWQYRPMWSPIVAERDKLLFADEERRFGYVHPGQPRGWDLALYRKRLIVPEPDRFYAWGAGEPLLTDFLRIPSLALVRVATLRGADLLDYQFRRVWHPIFLLVRLQGLLAGLCTIGLLFVTLRSEASEGVAILGAALLAALPPALIFFPNLHYDAILAPFVLLASVLLVREQFLLGGAAFGLALASKNSAVLLMPAALLFVAIEVSRRWREQGPAGGRACARRWMVGLAQCGAVALVVLAPFANPVSYAREILTPISHRAYDPRGENVSAVDLTSRASNPANRLAVGAPGTPATRVKVLVSYHLPTLLVIAALPLLWAQMVTPMSRFALCFLLMMFPQSLAFGDAIGHRSLMFLPFFAIVAARALKPRALVAILVALLAIDLVFVLDPVAARALG